MTGRYVPRVDVSRAPDLGPVSWVRYGCVDLEYLGAEEIRKLRYAVPTAGQWQSLFSVFVDDPELLAKGTLPPILGRYEILGDRIRFTPRYPLMKGLGYRARANLSALFDGSEGPI